VGRGSESMGVVWEKKRGYSLMRIYVLEKELDSGLTVGV
jgi:hypothetical protein